METISAKPEDISKITQQNVEEKVRLLIRMVQSPDFPENVLKKPERVSLLLGLCEEGLTISEIISKLAQAIPSSFQANQDILRLAGRILNLFEKEKGMGKGMESF